MIIGVFQGTSPAIFFVCSTVPVIVLGKFPVFLWELPIFSTKELPQRFFVGSFWAREPDRFFWGGTEVFPLATEPASMRCKFTTTIQLWTLVSATAVACA